VLVDNEDKEDAVWQSQTAVDEQVEGLTENVIFDSTTDTEKLYWRFV